MRSADMDEAERRVAHYGGSSCPVRDDPAVFCFAFCGISRCGCGVSGLMLRFHTGVHPRVGGSTRTKRLSPCDLLRYGNMAVSTEIYEAILTGDAPKARAATQAAIDAGSGPMELISDSMVLIG